MAGRPVLVSSLLAWRRQEGRKTRANKLAHSGISQSTVPFAVTGKFAVVRRLHHLADMDSVIWLDTHARGMRGGHSRNHGDREYGKHRDDTCEHAMEIGIAHENVHCRGHRASGKTPSPRDANEFLTRTEIQISRRSLRNTGRIGLLVVGVILAIFAGWRYAGTASPAAASEEVIERGRQGYADQCAACHGAELEGQPDWRSPLPSGRLPAPPHDASGHTWHHPDDILFRIVKEGTAAIVGGGYESDMPGFGDVLSDAEIRGVLDYIKSTWPERERSYQERVSQAN